MSGGVDSSVAAALLAEAGHDVVGVSMQLYDVREGNTGFGTCCTIDDLHDARRVAAAIGIPHYILNFEAPFRRAVIDNFVSEYAAGRTPIPCAHCNSDVKFATLLDRATGFGAEQLGTGHYARVARDHQGRAVLTRGADPAKDQSYFLFSLTQAQLTCALFPVGHLDKVSVRDAARRLGLEVADKPDSQEICFVPDGDYAELVERARPDTSRTGTIVDVNDQVVGTHGGVHRFTVGQRKGLGLSAGAPLYVHAIDARRGTVRVGPRSGLERLTLTASHVNWTLGTRLTDWTRVTAQIRHRHQPAAARVRALDENRAELVFDAPQVAITPGQAAVFYDGDVVLGGGWIE